MFIEEFFNIFIGNIIFEICVDCNLGFKGSLPYHHNCIKVTIFWNMTQ
jgi:hypothetical protein